MAQKRQFTPYEQNQLRQHGLSSINPQTIGDQPVEYLTGHSQFFDLDFLVTPDTLIPRLESETIVSEALDFIDKYPLFHPVIADIGTGSGCLGLSLAAKLTKAQIPYTIYLSDISPQALKIADLNAQRLLPSTVNLFFQESNLFIDFPKVKFDLIMANLPYIPSQNIPKLDPSVKDYEPHLALDGGAKGNLYINALLASLPEYLSPHGQAILEIDDTHTVASFTLPEGLSGTIENDCFDKPRFLLVKKSIYSSS